MNPEPGDVLLTHDLTIWARFIRLGAVLRHQPHAWNHVIVASHTDAAGTRWGIEARPGGVGWVDLAPWVANRWTLTNADQPKTDVQRAQVATIVKGMLGTPYDWSAIVEDGMTAINAPQLWRLPGWGATGVPAHVVCSSLAAWAYLKAGLPAPPIPDTRAVTPADWAEFILRRGWQH